MRKMDKIAHFSLIWTENNLENYKLKVKRKTSAKTNAKKYC